MYSSYRNPAYSYMGQPQYENGVRPGDMLSGIDYTGTASSRTSSTLDARFESMMRQQDPREVPCSNLKDDRLTGQSANNVAYTPAEASIGSAPDGLTVPKKDIKPRSFKQKLINSVKGGSKAKSRTGQVEHLKKDRKDLHSDLEELHRDAELREEAELAILDREIAALKAMVLEQDARREEKYSFDQAEEASELKFNRGANPISDRRMKRQSKQQKSGINLVPADAVKEPQVWAHTALRGEYLQSNPSFHDLQYSELVAGELEIISSLPHSHQRMGRVELLKRLSYLMKHHSWESVRACYIAVLCQVENGSLAWSASRAEFSMIIHETLVNQRASRQPAATHNKGNANLRKDQDTDYSQDAWCWNFNNGSCDESDPHLTIIKGQTVYCGHFCSRCWYKESEKRADHGAQEQSCPTRK